MAKHPITAKPTALARRYRILIENLTHNEAKRAMNLKTPKHSTIRMQRLADPPEDLYNNLRDTP